MMMVPTPSSLIGDDAACRICQVHEIMKDGDVVVNTTNITSIQANIIKCYQLHLLAEYGYITGTECTAVRSSEIPIQCGCSEATEAAYVPLIKSRSMRYVPTASPSPSSSSSYTTTVSLQPSRHRTKMPTTTKMLNPTLSFANATNPEELLSDNATAMNGTTTSNSNNHTKPMQVTFIICLLLALLAVNVLALILYRIYQSWQKKKKMIMNGNDKNDHVTVTNDNIIINHNKTFDYDDDDDEENAYVVICHNSNNKDDDISEMPSLTDQFEMIIPQQGNHVSRTNDSYNSSSHRSPKSATVGDLGGDVTMDHNDIQKDNTDHQNNHSITNNPSTIASSIGWDDNFSLLERSMYDDTVIDPVHANHGANSGGGGHRGMNHSTNHYDDDTPSMIDSSIDGDHNNNNLMKDDDDNHTNSNTPSMIESSIGWGDNLSLLEQYQYDGISYAYSLEGNDETVLMTGDNDDETRTDHDTAYSSMTGSVIIDSGKKKQKPTTKSSLPSYDRHNPDQSSPPVSSVSLSALASASVSAMTIIGITSHDNGNRDNVHNAVISTPYSDDDDVDDDDDARMGHNSTYSHSTNGSVGKTNQSDRQHNQLKSSHYHENTLPSTQAGSLSTRSGRTVVDGGTIGKDHAAINEEMSHTGMDVDITMRDDNEEHDHDMMKRVVVAPAGRLGIVIETTIVGPVVHQIFPNSPVGHMISLGDILVAINDIDTTTMSASAISNLICQTSDRSRTLTILTKEYDNREII